MGLELGLGLGLGLGSNPNPNPKRALLGRDAADRCEVLEQLGAHHHELGRDELERGEGEGEG